MAQQAPAKADVRPLAREAEALLRAQDEAVWSSWTQGTPLDLAKTYGGHEKLFALESLKTVDRALAETQEPREVRALTHLKVYLAGEYLSRGLSEHADAIANLEASMTFTVEGKEVPYRELERLLATEKSTPKRRALYTAAGPAVERLTRSLERRDQRLGVLLGELGYKSYETYGAELRQVDLDELGFLAEEVLGRTEAAYLGVLEKLAQKELSLPAAQLRRADLPRLVRPRGVDASFPKETLLPRATETLRGMGFDLGALANVKIDLAEGKKKNPRRLSLAVGVPGDIRLSMRPFGGARDQANLFHELGHCLHYGLSTEPRFELAKLGNVTVSEAYSFLFEDLVDDPVWLEQQAKLTGEKANGYLYESNANKLFRLRKAAGTLLYDLALRRSEGVDPKELHRAILSRAYGVSFTEEDAARYLVDAEELYESADDFRAWILAGQLQGQLKARFGPAWWQVPAAGGFLRGLWANANARSAEEIAREAGESGIRPDAMLLKLSAALGTAIAMPGVAQVADGGSWNARSGDGGAWVPAAWEKPKQVDAGDGGS
ncbi:MAG: chromosome segregation protein SMC [Myxococcaceae bacterium]